MATANLGFEEKVWQMADRLRGSMDSGEYKKVVLGLLLLKYVSYGGGLKSYMNN